MLFKLICLLFFSYSIFPKCISGDCQNGIGVDVDPVSKTRYEGEFVDGKKNGKGKLIDQEGNIYSGQWISEEPVRGTYRFKNGDRYSGNFKDRMFHGAGTMTYANGDRYTGEFKKDKKSGNGSMVYRSQKKIYIGKWKNNKENGTGRVYYFSDLEKGKFQNGVKVP
jgi:hypothetical protein